VFGLNSRHTDHLVQSVFQSELGTKFKQLQSCQTDRLRTPLSITLSRTHFFTKLHSNCCKRLGEI